MGKVKIGLWLLAILAAVGWLFCITAATAAAFGSTQLADGVVGALYHETAAVFPPIFLVFGAAVLVGVKLAPWKTRLEYWKVATRGAPRWLRRLALATLVLFGLAVVARLFASGLLYESAYGFTFQSGFAACLFALSCTLLVSGARLGLAQPRCPNNHPVACDMAECSLSGAPIAKVEF